MAHGIVYESGVKSAAKMKALHKSTRVLTSSSLNTASLAMTWQFIIIDAASLDASNQRK